MIPTKTQPDRAEVEVKTKQAIEAMNDLIKDEKTFADDPECRRKMIAGYEKMIAKGVLWLSQNQKL